MHSPLTLTHSYRRPAIQVFFFPSLHSYYLFCCSPFSHPLGKWCYFLGVSEYTFWWQQNGSGYSLQLLRHSCGYRSSLCVHRGEAAVMWSWHLMRTVDGGGGGSWNITVRLLEGLKASTWRLILLSSLPLTFSPPSLSHAQIVSDSCQWFPVMPTRLHRFHPLFHLRRSWPPSLVLLSLHLTPLDNERF